MPLIIFLVLQRATQFIRSAMRHAGAFPPELGKLQYSIEEWDTLTAGERAATAHYPIAIKGMRHWDTDPSDR